MKPYYLEVTYRKGRILAAYLYLPRTAGDTSARTETLEEGLLVDYTTDNRAIGVEITAPSACRLTHLNEVLTGLGFESLHAEDLAPLATVA